MSRWNIAAAAAVGERHVADARPCEDAWAVRLHHARGHSWLILAVSDGAGTAEQAQAGSAGAVAAFADAVERRLTDVEDLTVEAMRSCLDEARAALVAESEAASSRLRDFAATLLGAVIGSESSAFVQIGDGAIVVAGDEPGSWAWMFEPRKGEYVNETSFITDTNAGDRASVAVLAYVPAEIAVFTDGLENLLIRSGPDRQVVGAFFEQMFPPVRGARAPGVDRDLSAHLADYLLSPQIAARTDDDRTLVLATARRDGSALAVGREQCAMI